MGYTQLQYESVEPRARGAMHFLRDPLDCEQLGITVIDVDDEWSGREHDHAEEDHEEVYLLTEGSARMTVDGEELALDPGDAVRVDPDATRALEFDDGGRMIVAGAP